MDNLSNIEKLRWRCYQIIPLVFDEALSYYEVLCKGAKKTNELIDFVNEMAEQVEENKNNISSLTNIVGTGSVDDRIYGAELAAKQYANEGIATGVREAKAYTDEKIATVEEAISELNEGASIRITITGAQPAVDDVDSATISGDISKGIKELKVTSWSENSASAQYITSENHMFEFMPYSYGSSDHILAFWHLIRSKWFYVKLCFTGTAHTYDASRSSIASLN